MTRAFLLAFCLLLPFNSLVCEESGQDIFSRAEELFAATLYQESLPLYLKVGDPSLQSKVLFRVGQVYFYDRKYAEALRALEKADLSSLEEALKEEVIFLQAVCHRHLEAYGLAISLLSSRPFAAFKDEAAFELGLALFLEGKSEAAVQRFEGLEDAVEKPDLYILSKLYLARLALAQSEPEKALAIMKAVGYPLPKELNEELAYLAGVAALQGGDYAAAFERLMIAMPQNAAFPADKRQGEVLYNIGWMYLKQAQAEPGCSQLPNWLGRSEEIFLELASAGEDERFVIALARSYLLKAKLLHDPAANLQADNALKGFSHFSEEAMLQALLMRAEAAVDYEARCALYDQFIQAGPPSSDNMAKAWYFLALTHYEQASEQKSADFFSRAAAAFEKAYGLLADGEERKTCLKYYAQSCWECGAGEGKAKALCLLQSALQASPDDQELNAYFERYVMLLANDRLPDEALQKIETVLRQRAYMQSSPSGLLVLGAFLYKRGLYGEAQKVYFEIVENFPASEDVPQALLQASLAWEHSQVDPQKIHILRKKIYEDFPASPAAAQAYFITYTYQDYLQGNRAAIKHLENFKDRFPNSPLLINVNYLLGLDVKRDRHSPEGKWIRKKDPIQSVHFFSEASAAFDRLYAKDSIPPQECEYYAKLAKRAALEKALVYYGIAEDSSAAKRDIYFKYAVEALEELQLALEDPDDILLARFQDRAEIMRLQEECLYWLGLTHVKAGQIDKGALVFKKMLEGYALEGKTVGYYLSRIYYELGNIALQQHNYEEALALYRKSDDASKGRYLGADERLGVWLAQSECFTALDQFENAMLVLAKVINDDSTSHLRLKAMVLRADLYEKLGRPELARRQLEFVAKMEGTWAEKAKLKLEQNYANH